MVTASSHYQPSEEGTGKEWDQGPSWEPRVLEPLLTSALLSQALKAFSSSSLSAMSQALTCLTVKLTGPHSPPYQLAVSCLLLTFTSYSFPPPACGHPGHPAPCPPHTGVTPLPAQCSVPPCPEAALRAVVRWRVTALMQPCVHASD